MILTQQQVDGIRQRHDNAGHAHGYPAGMITDLLHTLAHMNQEKKRWQHLAAKRGDRLKRIAAICGTEVEE